MTDSAALAQENIIVVKGKIGYLLKFHYYNIKGILPFIEGTTSYSKNKKNSEDPKESSCKKRTELGLGAGVQILLEKKLTAQIMGNYMKSTYKEKSVRVGLTYKF
ncbi:MAG TPA: hypothetical protein VI959_03520 [Alphaproteobacteria bacterium]|nr:hypothetical protein [Alphaproteobacteria bacterium]